MAQRAESFKLKAQSIKLKGGHMQGARGIGLKDKSARYIVDLDGHWMPGAGCWNVRGVRL